MPKAPRHSARAPLGELILGGKRHKAPPHEFVLDAVASLSPVTRPMFGCLAVYVEEKIVLILRDKPASRADNGVWLATAVEHHDSLRREFPQMRSIRVLGRSPTNWQVLPAEAPDFEEAALRACELVLARDPLIGKIPQRDRIRKPRAKTPKGRRTARIIRAASTFPRAR